MSLTRRSLLGVLAGVVVAGCRPRRHRREAADVRDSAALTSAAHAEEGLIADYDQAIAGLDAVAAGDLMRARQRHAAHLRALRSVARGASPASAPAGTGSAALTSTLLASAASLRAAAVSAHDGPTAALLASIAAEHAADATTTAGSR